VRGRARNASGAAHIFNPAGALLRACGIPQLAVQKEQTMEPIARSNSTTFPTTSMANDGALNRTAAGIHGAVDRAAEEAAGVVKPVIDRAAQLAHQAVDRAAAVAAPTADWVRHQGDSLKATQQRITGDAAHYVGAHPWKSLAFALAAGFVVSRFMR